MAGEIQFIFETTGSTLYYALRKLSAQMWNTSGTPAWEARTVANWGDYDIALSETPADSFLYLGDMPAVDAGWYWVDIYEQSGASPAIADDTLVGQMLGYWNGTAFRINEADIQAECEAAIDEKGHLLQSADAGATAVARQTKLDDIHDMTEDV
jgi:hypothetical protein